ncbi:hypothetical protein [Tychonema sp. LEGE 07203]|nr:hypothetical protein [Tychonema sp. LEGE 07203]
MVISYWRSGDRSSAQTAYLNNDCWLLAAVNSQQPTDYLLLTAF